MDHRKSRWLKTGIAVLTVVALAGFLGACKGKQAEEAAPAEAAPAVKSEAVTVEAVKAIMGEAMDDQPGVVDMTQGEGEYVIAYRYYDEDLQDIDNDMAMELAPKIQALYEKYHQLDRVVFQISVNSETPAEWKPYASFALDRKTVDEIEWSGLLSEQFLASVLEFKKYE